MSPRSIRFYIFVIGAIVGLLAPAQAGDGCCDRCGCTANCRKLCRLVCEDKKVEVVCWGCKCEEFCVAGPSKPGCKHCECVCGTCDEKGSDSAVCAKPKRFVWFNWLPGCAQCYTRTKLMKKTVTVTVPSHKWVVEDLCSQCAAACSEIESTDEVLPAATTPSK
jgi:hypothetical protein